MEVTPRPVIRLVSHAVRRYTVFLMVGAMNAAVDILVFNLILWFAPTRTNWALSLYNSVAVIAAIVNSYVWNRKITFRDTATGAKREKFWFIGQALLNLCLNDAIVVWISSYLIFNKSVPFFISSNAAKGVAMMLSSAVSYFCMRYLVFRRVRATDTTK